MSLPEKHAPKKGCPWREIGWRGDTRTGEGARPGKTLELEGLSKSRNGPAYRGMEADRTFWAGLRGMVSCVEQETTKNGMWRKLPKCSAVRGGVPGTAFTIKAGILPFTHGDRQAKQGAKKLDGKAKTDLFRGGCVPTLRGRPGVALGGGGQGDLPAGAGSLGREEKKKEGGPTGRGDVTLG